MARVVRGLAVVVLACMMGLAVANEYNGLPRPAGYPKTPTEDYGPTPPCYLNSVPVTCDWYGFAHVLYPVLGAECLIITRRELANTTAVPLGYLEPYNYYFLNRMVFNTTNNASYCLYGCFDMSATSPSSAPVPSTTQTPLLSPPAPPVTPPVSAPVTPPVSAPVTPPVNAPVTAPASPPAVTPAVSPPAPTTPAVVPPPPGPGLLNLNGAGLLQPTGLGSFIVSGALLMFHGLVGF